VVVIYYICLKCRRTFENLGYWEERHGLDTPPYEKTYCCPLCKSTDYIEYIGRCSLCGSDIFDKYIVLDTGEKYCSECYTEYDVNEY